MGALVEPVPLHHYDQRNRIFRVLNDVTGDRYIKVDDVGNVELVVNATEDYLLLSPKQDYAKIDFDADADARQFVDLLDDHFIRWLSVDPALRGFLTCYALALPLVRGVRNVKMYPIMHLTGPSESGKSETLSLINAWLYGSADLLKSDRGFGVSYCAEVNRFWRSMTTRIRTSA